MNQIIDNNNNNIPQTPGEYVNLFGPISSGICM